MCLHPSTLPDGLTVGCRVCWQCNKDRTDDLVGRCIAESQTSTQTVAVTLTYAGEVPNAAVLVYRDVQLLFKRLRADGIKLRYIVAGEYGSQNGRAHWHAVLFIQKGRLDVQFNRNLDWKYWPHGFAFFQNPGPAGIRYIMKYAVKDSIRGEVKKGHLAMSKKPPLGYAYLMDLARTHALQGVVPRGPNYSFPEAFDRKGRRIQFTMRGRTLELFCETFLEAYRLKYGREPYSEWFTETYLDKIARREMEEDTSDYAEKRRRARRESIYHGKKIAEALPEPETSEPQFCAYLEVKPGEAARLGFGHFQVHLWLGGAIHLYSPEGGQYWHVGNVADGATALQKMFARATQLWNGGDLVPDQTTFVYRLHSELASISLD